jgi:hypothetical protein
MPKGQHRAAAQRSFLTTGVMRVLCFALPNKTHGENKMSRDLLFGIRSKIEWTQKHATDLKNAIGDFLNLDPYKVATERDPDTRKLVYKVSHVQDVPMRISHMTGDVLFNMASILDHLFYGIYRKYMPKGDSRRICFPISSTAQGFAARITAFETEIRVPIDPNLKASLDAIEAYKGGKGEPLWVMKELNNLSKHRDLVTIGVDATRIIEGPHTLLFHRPYPLKVGDILVIETRYPEPIEKVKFNFAVSLSEPPIVKAEPLAEVIDQLFSHIDNIVNQFKGFL